MIGGEELHSEFVSDYGDILIQDSDDLTTRDEFKHCGLYEKPRDDNYVASKVNALIEEAKKSKSYIPITNRDKESYISLLKGKLKQFEDKHECFGKISIARPVTVIANRKLYGDKAEDIKESSYWSVDGKGGSSKLHKCRKEGKSNGRSGLDNIDLKFCDDKGNYSFNLLEEKGVCVDKVIKDDLNRNNCRVKETFRNCTRSFSLGFADNSFEITEKSLLKEKLAEVQACIGENIKKSNGEWKLKGITISGTSNGFRNSKSVGEYRDQDFLKKNISGYISSESQQKLYLSYNALSRLRAARAKELATASWENDLNLKGVKVIDQAFNENHYGICPYDKQGKTLPKFQNKSLEKNNMVYIQVNYDPPATNIDRSRCSIKHKFYCRKPLFTCK